jgi:hypothetical protein
VWHRGGYIVLLAQAVGADGEKKGVQWFVVTKLPTYIYVLGINIQNLLYWRILFYC